METNIPWKELTEAIELFYPKPEGASRRPIRIERVPPSTYQHRLNLSDPAVEEAL